ncbi:unnamed protein product (macronuclear) [Paramecium tetraurelia]|uniref:Cyclic nucleotide-binding domain-containing protein n=1 Tax=Paramecium tetraurelia TaxID=5888 RepID=A0E7V1_PARTE|nr:uncharacterized protein GSPATT00024096001 [Paramecium tetraurelia]CAK91368.1 unnamed protein product [Paramecium tetraurelia]|eukprot:XP_001458765.1 hypothetical protein (macronuclear) [Paramecium tetraurelia strain d4-2]
MITTNRDLISSTTDSAEYSQTIQLSKRKTTNKQFSLSLFALRKQELYNKRSSSYYSPNISISKIKPVIDYRSKFKQNTKKLIIILSFFESLSQYSKEQLRQRIEYFKLKKQNILPFYPDQYLIIKWNQFIQLLLFFYAIVYPLQLANQINVDQILLGIDFIFAIDIMMNFITAYIDENYNLVKEFKLIFLNYLKTWMIFDLISLPQYQLQIQQSELQMFKLLRLIKYFIKKPQKNYKGQIFYTTNIIDSFSLDINYYLSEGWIFLINVILNAFLLIHIFGCIFLFHDTNFNYITSVYWASQTLFTEGYGDIPQNFQISVIWIIVSIGYYSVKIGDFAKLLMQTNLSNDDNQYYLFDRLALQTKMPDDLKDSVQKYIRTNAQYNQFWDQEIIQMVDEFHKPIQTYFTLSVMLDLCIKIQFFLQDVNHTQNLLKSCKFITFEKNEIIYRKGQFSDEIYYLIKGDVRIVSKNRYNILTILQGTIFGEFEALNEQPRFTYAIAQQRSLILIVQLKSFIECFKQSKLINFEVSQLYARRKQLILQQFKLEKIELKRLKRKNLIIFEDNDISPEFKKRKTNDNHLQTNQIYHYNLLKKIIGQAKLNKQIVYQRFQFCVNRVIDYIRQIDTTPPEDWKDLNEYQTITKVIPLKLLQQRNCLFRQQNRQSNFSMLSFNKKLRLSNYILVRQQEINIQRKIILFSKMQRERFKPLKQIFDKYGRIFDNQSESDILNFESSYSSKITLLQSKYCQWFNVKQHEEIKINKNIVNNVKKLSQDLSKINDTWLQGSLIKFDLHKYLNQN